MLSWGGLRNKSYGSKVRSFLYIYLPACTSKSPTMVCLFFKLLAYCATRVDGAHCVYPLSLGRELFNIAAYIEKALALVFLQ